MDRVIKIKPCSMKFLKYFITCFACFIILNASAQTYKPATFATADRLKKIEKLYPLLDSMFSNYMHEKKFPSIVYGLVVDGKLVHTFSEGMINLDKKIAATSASDYHIASMTKSFTAMAILKLRDDGKLQLDDPVSKYIPQVKNSKKLTSDAPDITIRMLLTHNAGFPEDNPWGDRQLGRSDEYLEQLYANGVSFSTTPGTAYEYSNLGFATLGLIIKKVSGQTYQQYIHENIIQPLGMHHTYWDYKDVPADKLAIGYRYIDGQWIAQPLLHSGSFGAMGGLITTIEDFSKYMAFHLSAWPPRDNKETGPVKRSSVREMQHAWNFAKLWMNETDAFGKSCPVIDSYCYGLHQYLDCNGMKVITHSGGLPGFGSQWRIIPDYGIGIVAFANLTYAQMGNIIERSLDTLLVKASLSPRELPESMILEKRKDQIIHLLPDWKDAKQSGIFADNFFDDYFLDELKKESKDAFNKVGKITSVSDMVASNQLRGYFLMHGEKGDIKIYFTLSPEPDPKVQAFRLSVDSGSQ